MFLPYIYFTNKLINYYSFQIFVQIQQNTTKCHIRWCYNLLHLSQTLSFYKRRDIQEEIVRTASGREVAIKYGDKGYGKRPDTLSYPTDVLELAKNGATSFHISEERWTNPLNLSTDMHKRDVDRLRAGWDLVIDIDFPLWSTTKIITSELIKALKAHGIESVSVKFSGNKGFHIGVPFESFPSVFPEGESKLLFPDASKRIVLYLLDYIDSKANDFAMSKRILATEEFKEYLKTTPESLMTINVCAGCETEIKQKLDSQYEYLCSFCGHSERSDEDASYILCKKCKKPMDKSKREKSFSCHKCGSKKTTTRFNWKVDTLLISSRHLYRSVYSMHEKSGLVSVPVDPEKIMDFEKVQAKPENIKVDFKNRFLDLSTARTDEARRLVISAHDFRPKQDYGTFDESEQKNYKEYDLPEHALGEETFPPCIKNILKGIKDGKKRSLFVLVNFLSSIGWSAEQMEKLLVEWNSRNEEKLREVNIKGQLRYHVAQKKNILPPSCSNKGYYIDFGVCTPDELCQRIKNPVQYAKYKDKILNESKKKKKNVENTEKKSTDKVEKKIKNSGQENTKGNSLSKQKIKSQKTKVENKDERQLAKTSESA